MQFQFYVLNYDFNKQEAVMFNLFANDKVQRWSENAVKKYLRSPSKYTRDIYHKEDLPGWDSFVKEIDSIIMCEEWSRCEYEFSVNEKFVTEIDDVVRDTVDFTTVDEFKNYLEKKNRINHRSTAVDCYDQAHANIETICHEIIRQYKEQKKK